MKHCLILTALLLSGCEFPDARQCGVDICFPSQSKILGQREASDALASLVIWDGEHFGVYEGASTDFRFATAEPIALPFDKDARIGFDENGGYIIAKSGASSPKFVQIIGPCQSRGQPQADCSVVRFAKGVTGKGSFSGLIPGL